MRSKKLMATLLAGTMALSLAACSSSSSEDKTSTSSKAAESKTEDAGKDDTTKATDESKAPEETKAPDAGTDAPAPSGETIKLTIWGAEEDQDLLKTLVDGFKSTYGSVANFDIQIGVESESSAKDTILTDIEAAADVFAFASDQINELYKAGALANIEQLAETVDNKRENLIKLVDAQINSIERIAEIVNRLYLSHAPRAGVFHATTTDVSEV